MRCSLRSSGRPNLRRKRLWCQQLRLLSPQVGGWLRPSINHAVQERNSWDGMTGCAWCSPSRTSQSLETCIRAAQEHMGLAPSCTQHRNASMHSEISGGDASSTSHQPALSCVTPMEGADGLLCPPHMPIAKCLLVAGCSASAAKQRSPCSGRPAPANSGGSGARGCMGGPGQRQWPCACATAQCSDAPVCACGFPGAPASDTLRCSP